MPTKVTTPPVVICDHDTPGEAMYLVLPDGFVMLDGEDCVPDWECYMGDPRCHKKHEPKGPVVTRMELETCPTCDGKGESLDRWESEIDIDEERRPYRVCYPVNVKCDFCDGTGWRYDWGSNVSLAKILEEVRGPDPGGGQGQRHRTHGAPGELRSAAHSQSRQGSDQGGFAASGAQPG